MRKIIGLGAAVILSMVLVSSAMAQPPEPPEIDVEKDLTISETFIDEAEAYIYGDFDKIKLIDINIDKDIYVDIDAVILPETNGESENFSYQLNTENEFLDGVPDPTDAGNTREAAITGSLLGNSGVIGVNQSPGNLNDQANLTSLSLVTGEEALVEANNFAVQGNIYNVLFSYYSTNTDVIADSINDNEGVVGVNQSSGNMNIQLNSTAIATAGLDCEADVVGALAEVSLKQVTMENYLLHVGTARSDTITNSINCNAGIVNVNQASGDMVCQANMVSIAHK